MKKIQGAASRKKGKIGMLVVVIIVVVFCILNVPANKTKMVLNIWGDEFKENSIQVLENESAKERMHGVILDGVFEESENEIKTTILFTLYMVLVVASMQLGLGNISL